MQQTPAANGADEVAGERSRLIKAERARQGLSQAEAVRLINEQLRGAGEVPITRGHLANIELCRRPLSGPVLRAVAAALGIREAQLRHPLVDLRAAA